MECMINTLSGKKSNLKLVLNSSSLKLDCSHFLHIGTKGAKLKGGKYFPFLNSPSKNESNNGRNEKGANICLYSVPCRKIFI